MNTTLHITERIDKALNILQRIPGLQGFDQWNPVCECMKVLAGISQDIQKYEAENPSGTEADDAEREAD